MNRKAIAAGACGILLLMSSAGAAVAQKKVPPGAGGRGEAGYELGCAMMWMMNIPVCAELPNYPARFKERQREI